MNLTTLIKKSKFYNLKIWSTAIKKIIIEKNAADHN